MVRVKVGGDNAFRLQGQTITERVITTNCPYHSVYEQYLCTKVAPLQATVVTDTTFISSGWYHIE